VISITGPFRFALRLRDAFQLDEERIRAGDEAELFIDVDCGSVAARDVQERYVAIGSTSLKKRRAGPSP
jgi:hypothetical protein